MKLLICRTIIIYLCVLFAMRLMGKRQLGELQPSELVITILISNIATLPLEDTSIPLVLGILPILTLVCFEVVISWVTLKSLRDRIGFVQQDVYLFSGSVADNIAYGKPDATDEEIIAAAKAAHADSFIRRLPDGYDTMLTGDGANLSQGQRQLLAIARAAIADPPVLILDEATSSIDTRTERIVQDGMDKLMHGRTTFVIAHRLSTVRNSDCIMVLEQGRIIERGTHDELIEEKGRYYQLYTGNAISV